MRRSVSFVVFAALAVLVMVSVVAAEGGKEMFEKKCAMCHGKDGVAKPIAKGAGNFNDTKWQVANTAEAITQTITNGRGKMLSYKDKLKPEEIKALAEYIKTLGPAK
jgi:cytochrome c6